MTAAETEQMVVIGVLPIISYEGYRERQMTMKIMISMLLNLKD
jgi:hypothetical protein